MILEKMNLEEVINPHYAFPIVGVILCALLVFAFGFKTPAQPPSFDFEENRRVTGKKKQKSKEKLKIVQNGSTPHPKGITSVVRAQPEVETVSPVVEKQTTKFETKSKVKKLPAVQQQPAQPEVKQVTAPEDTTGGKWKQQLSKKDRKNRKKDDPPEPEKKAKTQNKGDTPPTKEKIKDPKESSAPVEEVVKEDDPPPETKTKTETTGKDKEPKKKAAKLETKPLPAEPEKKSEQTKAKKEKKTEEVKPKVVEKPPEISKPVEAKQAPVPATTQDTEKSITSDKPSTENNANDGSTNIAFDELRDMWQDSKPQKKKKKARRE